MKDETILISANKSGVYCHYALQPIQEVNYGIQEASSINHDHLSFF